VDSIAIDARCDADLVFNSGKYEKMEYLINGTYGTFGSSKPLWNNNEKEPDIKSNFKLKYYYRSLLNFSKNGFKDAAYKYIYDKILNLLSRIFDFYGGEFLIENMYYDKNNIKDLAAAVLKLQYEYIKNNAGRSIDLESRKWELPLIFIKIDDNLFTSYFLDYKKDLQ
jgi:hypothetical protein